MRRFGIIGLVLSALSLPFVVSPASAATATITLKPQVGPPTTKVTVKGSGFGATETVNVKFDATLMVKATSDAVGSFSASFAVPSAAVPGSHPVSATGKTSLASASAVFLVRTDWPRFHFDEAGSGYNPYENVIGTANVSSLTQAWAASTQLTYSSPVVAGGYVYVNGYYGTLYAFSAAGLRKCFNVPKTCSPLWTASTGGGFSTPTVSNGVLYVAGGGDNLLAFSATGKTPNCQGTPKVCIPLWKGDLPFSGNQTAGAVVAKGIVYFPSGWTLYAFSAAAGPSDCSGAPTKTCTPLWSATTQNIIPVAPAVANGVVYVTSDVLHPGQLYAFSTAAGPSNCSGSPKTCTPLWTGATPNAIHSAPAVANGIVYTSDDHGALSAFSAAAGPSNCSGSPKTCTPIWTTNNGASYVTPTIANGIVYTEGLNSFLNAFSANGTTGCDPVTKVCQRLWTTAQYATGPWTTPAVANGVVYVGDYYGRLTAYSAGDGATCLGTPKICSPLWLGPTTNFTTTPAIADGVVFMVGSDKLFAFGN